MFEWDRRTQLVVVILAAALVFGAGIKYGQAVLSPETEITVQENETAAEAQGKQIFVHVAGAVEKPGLYGFDAGARVRDAVEKAVASPAADLGAINLALPLQDGSKVTVPAVDFFSDRETASGVPDTLQNAGSANNGQININLASEAELQTLPGIGPVYAERIVAYREEHGGFTSIEELQEVSGIGPKTLEKIIDLVCIY